MKNPELRTIATTVLAVALGTWALTGCGEGIDEPSQPSVASHIPTQSPTPLTAETEHAVTQTDAAAKNLLQTIAGLCIEHPTKCYLRHGTLFFSVTGLSGEIYPWEKDSTPQTQSLALQFKRPTGNTPANGYTLSMFLLQAPKTDPNDVKFSLDYLQNITNQPVFVTHANNIPPQNPAAAAVLDNLQLAIQTAQP